MEQVQYDGTPLSRYAIQAIEDRITEGLADRLPRININSGQEEIQIELFEKRKQVLEYLALQGYTVYIESVGDTTIMNNGWGLSQRPLESVPDKLRTTGNPLHYRGEFTHKNYRLWVYLH